MGSQPLTVSENLEEQINTARGSGQPLNKSVRSCLEPQFKSDFSQVRIHTDAKADTLSQQLGARAFTTGGDIFFRSGEYDPETPSGQKLLAHELTHTQQQGASKRIAGWWPKGHRLITELAGQKFTNSYTARALKYLAGRSPDMDFKSDGFRTMNKGIEESKKQLKIYEKLIASKDPKKIAKAKLMYDKNTLHRRKFSFVLDHGEGGAYKVPGKSTNEGKTNTLILNAWGKWKKSSVGALSILSDALHQAEDRGAHGEGDPFKGHDIRKTLYKREWETNYDTTEPDNVSQNSEGATLALGYAENVLSKFKEAVHLPPGKKIGISRIKEFFKKRRRVRAWGKHTHYLPLWAKSSDPISHMVGQTGLGRKDGLKKLRAIITRTTKDPAMKAAYERARDPRQKKEILNLELRNVVQNPEQNPELIKQLEEVLKKQRR